MEPFSAFLAQRWIFQLIEIGAGATSIGAIWKYILVPAKAGFLKVKEWGGEFDEKMDLLDQIAHSIGPNGGSSLADSLERVEGYLHVLDNQQKAAFELSGAPVFRTGINGEYTSVNRCWTELFDLDIMQAAGSGWMSIIHPDDRDKVEEEWNSAVKEQRMFVQSFRCYDADGNIIIAKCQAVPLKADDKFLGFMGLMRIKKEQREVTKKRKVDRRKKQ